MSFACPHCGKTIYVSVAYGGAPLDESALVESLSLTYRPYNVLKEAGVNTLIQLTALSERDLRRMHNLGKVSIQEIKSALLEKNLALKPGRF